MQEKFCKHCGEKIPYDAVICTRCGRQVEEMHVAKDSPIIINNNNNNNNSANSSSGYYRYGKKCSKWVSLLLCIFLGFVGGHKFYEGKIGTGIFYMLTFGGFFIGELIDFFNILGKPDPYYVN